MPGVLDKEYTLEDSRKKGCPAYVRHRDADRIKSMEGWTR